VAGSAQRYYDANAELIAGSFGRVFNGALISRAGDLETCVAEDFRYVVEAAGLEEGQAVLEGGCGGGFFCRELRERFPGVRYTGVDLSAGQLAVARRLNPGAEFRQGGFEDLELPAAHFDRALFLESIGYCVDLDRLAQQLHRALKPGGQVFVKNPGQKITDYHDYLGHRRYFDPVRREYGFADEAVGIVPDIDFIVKKFGLYGLLLLREDHPYFNEYHYTALFFAPDFSRVVRGPERTTITFDFSRFDPGRSLTELGRRHPEYIAYHRRQAEGTGYRMRNRLFGCVVLVFARAG
jgi:SAM-dependent methyltransferase